MKNYIKILYLTIYIFFSSNCMSQDIYLLQGQKYNYEIDLMEQYPVCLYHINNDSLRSLQKMTIDNSYVKNIRLYFNQKKIIIYYNQTFNDTSKFKIIDFNNDIYINDVNLMNNEFHCYNNYCVNKDSLFYLLVERINKDYKKWRLLGINTQTNKRNTFSDADLQYYIGDGLQGFGVEDILYFDEAGHLYIKAEYDETGNIYYFRGQ